MCGFSGFLGYGGLGAKQARSVAWAMGNAIAHRGPDDSRVWQDDAVQIALAHRRLSILDLSPTGHQPMISPSGRYVVTFNGEIYNHWELRAEIERRENSVAWRGHSDTETLLAGIDTWGLIETLKRAVGMFALALWDRQERTLYLARDRIGEKPLYYGWQRGVFLFGSELKAIRLHPAFIGDIDRDAITLQLRHNYIPAPYSIYQNIKKLPAGCFFNVSMTDGKAEEKLQSYWSFIDVAKGGQEQPFMGSDVEAIETLENRLTQAVAQQMVADVPLGAFLSGGIDSSIIVALMQAQSSKPVQTFCIGFNEGKYNEAQHAKAVAHHLGTQHTELYVTPQQALDIIPRLPSLYDEPFSDSSQIPTFILAKMTRQHVTVSLSGDAGDELFGGYNRYFLTRYIWGKISKMPFGLRRLLARILLSVSPDAWTRIFDLISPLLPRRARFPQPGEKILKLGEILTTEQAESLYCGLISHWKNPSALIPGAVEPSTVLSTRPAWSVFSDIEHRMMAVDCLSYLPDDILVKVDRAAMGVSLETRIPFLDHRVIEFAWRLPLHMKLRHTQGKWILRQILYKYIPPRLIERPKMGFGIPIDDWLRGPLRDWAEALLNEHRLRREGFFNPALIRKKWAEHLSGQRNWQYHLWDVLMFQLWFEQEKLY